MRMLILVLIFLVSCSPRQKTDKAGQKAQIPKAALDTSEAFLKRAIFDGEKVDARQLLLCVDTAYGNALAAESDSIAYRIIRLDMDGNGDKEWLVHFYDTVDFPFHLVALFDDDKKGKPVYLGYGIISTEGIYDMSMPVIDTVSATIWMKVNSTGTCMGGFFYRVFAFKDGALREVDSFPGKYGMNSCGTNKNDGKPEEYWLCISTYESDPVYGVIYCYTDIACGVEEKKGKKIVNHNKLTKKHLELFYIKDRQTDSFICTDVYGKEIKIPFDSKDFYDLYQNGTIGQSTVVCDEREDLQAVKKKVIKTKVRIKNHIVETSVVNYATDTFPETRPELYQNRIVMVDGVKFDIDQLYRQKRLYGLYETCCFSNCVTLYEFIDRQEIHIDMPASGCCCGNCSDYQILNIRFWRNGKTEVDFFDNPTYEYWSI